MRRRLPLMLLLALCGTVGCATRSHTERTEELVRLYAAGRYERAVEVAAELAEQSDRRVRRQDVPRDGLIVRLEQGAALRTAGDLAASDRVFQRADQILDLVSESPLVKLDEETASLWTNPTALAYRGTASDAVLLSVFQAMNQLELGDLELAQVYLRRADERIDTAAERYEREIRQDQEEAERAVRRRGGRLDDATVGRLRAQAGNDSTIARRYGDFGNPLANYLDGAVFLSGQPSRGDLERAVVSLRRAVELEPRNESARHLLDVAERSASAGEVVLKPLVHVIHAAGMAPTLLESRVEVPLVLFGGNINRLGVPSIALPYLAYGPAAGDLVVRADGVPIRAEEILDVAGLVTAEFDAGYGRRVSRQIAGLTVKLLAAAAVNTAADRAVRESDAGVQTVAFLLSRLITGGFQLGTTAADLRTWRLLPGRFDVASFERPLGGTFDLGVGGRTIRVFTEPDGTSFVFVRVPSPGADPVVRVANVPDRPLSTRRVASP